MKIVRGVETAVTEFFIVKTRDVKRSETAAHRHPCNGEGGAGAEYNGVAAKAEGMGLIKREEADLKAYVTGKALDGLYNTIAEEERKIRRDPVATGSAILKKVFGG